MGIEEASCWYRAHGVSIQGKIRFIENCGEQDEGGHHVAKRSSAPRQAYPQMKLQGRYLVRIVGTVAPFVPLGVGTRGKFFLSSPGEKWAQETYAGCR